MKTLKSVFLLSSLALSGIANAGTMYDDWQVERVPDQIKKTTLYWGNNTCEAYIKNGYYEPYARLESRNVPLAKSEAISNPRPTYQISVPYVDQNNNPTYKLFACQTVANYPNSYVKEEVISYKNKYTPIQPYASYLRYELGGCNGYVREGTLDIGEPGLSASNMKVYISYNENDFANTLIYDGAPTSLIGVDVAAPENYQRRNVRVKFDEGSSAYLSIRPIKCNRGEVTDY